MKKFMKRMSTAVMALFLLALAGCQGHRINVAEVIGTDAMEIEYYSLSTAIHCEDVNHITTYASYVFVGEVVAYERTEYANDDAWEPTTVYSVKVLENIKGELRTDEPIEVKKYGGIHGDKDVFLIENRDILPQPGKTYIFAPIVREGDLRCSLPYMVVEVDPSDYAESDVYKQHVEACKTEAPGVENGNQYKSKYDGGATSEE